MFNSFRAFLGRKIAQLRLWFKKQPAVPVNLILQPGRSILVCLSEHDNAGEISELLRKELAAQNIILVTENTSPVWGISPEVKVVSLSESRLSFFCFPEKGLVEDIRKQKVDIAIDLHRRFSLPSAYLCAYSGAAIRASFYTPQASGFFNLEYHPREPSPQAYHKLIKMLGSIGAIGSQITTEREHRVNPEKRAVFPSSDEDPAY